MGCVQFNRRRRTSKRIIKWAKDSLNISIKRQLFIILVLSLSFFIFRLITEFLKKIDFMDADGMVRCDNVTFFLTFRLIFLCQIKISICIINIIFLIQSQLKLIIKWIINLVLSCRLKMSCFWIRSITIAVF